MSVTPEEADRVNAATGLDVAGRQHVISSDYLRHIENRHGPGSGDRWPLTSDDWARLPDVLSTPDRVELSQETHLGLPVIRYEKEIGDRYIAAELVLSKRNQLLLISYAKRPGGPMLPANRPPEP